MKKLYRLLYKFTLGALIVSLVWWIAAKLLGSPALADPLCVYASLPELLDTSMWRHLMHSLYRIVAGVAIATAIGMPAGILMGLYKGVNKILGAAVYFSYPVPKLALLPAVMLLAGIGEVTKITMIVLIIVFQIIISVRDSVRHIPSDCWDLMTSLGAGKRDLLTHLVLPATLPDFFTTLRVATGTAVSALFVTETYGTDCGMGFFIVDAWMRIDYVAMYGGIVMLGTLGFFIFILIDIMHSVFCKWKETN